MKFDERIQLIIVGDSAVGKTSILHRYDNISLLDTLTTFFHINTLPH